VCAHGTHTIEVPRRIASERGGLCLSEEYRNLREPLAWRCQAGHEWSAGLGNVMGHGTWCPYCPYRSEDECRRLFEELTGQRFPKSRPAWLGGLELDGANYGLSLAFEYQGEQHYAVVPHWHRRGAADLAEQQARDQRKRELCQSQGIALIEVPYWVKDRRAYIAEALASHRTTRTLQPEPARSGSATAVCALTDAELDELLDL
jgi:hypothetical protein